MTEKTAEEIIDDFLLQLDAGNYRIINDFGIGSGRSQFDLEIRDKLMLSIESYTKVTNDLKPEDEGEYLFIRHAEALTCLTWLRKARMINLIEENPSFRTQIESIEQENENLRELNSKLRKDISHLEKLNEGLNETIKRLTAKGLRNASGGTPQ